MHFIFTLFFAGRWDKTLGASANLVNFWLHLSSMVKYAKEHSKGKASKVPTSPISGPSPQSRPRTPPESRFEAFRAPARKVAPGGFQRAV